MLILNVNNQPVQNNSPISFDFEGFDVRVLTDENGEPWFVAADVSSVLGYSQTNAMNKLIDTEDKRKVTLHIGGNYVNQSLINESGLYQAIFGSTLPTAKKFKKWVTSEVLPQIRKTGSYQSQHPYFDIAGALENMDDKGLQLVNLLNCSVTGLIKDRNRLIGKIEEDAPKVQGYEALIEATGTISIADCAKALDIDGIGPRTLFAILREEKILQAGKSGTRNVPYQKFVNAGYFTVKNSILPTGRSIMTTRVTPKGQDYILKVLRKNWID